MANLPTIGQRLNDVEINNNKPVASQVFRRIGSNINFLLDFLSITDGSSSPGGGAFNQFSSPQSLTYSHTFTNADLNNPITLFTFEGADDRPLYFYKDNGSGFANAGTTGTTPLRTLPDAYHYRFAPSVNPIWEIAYNLANANVGGAGNAVAFEIKVNGVNFARTITNTSTTVDAIEYFSEITQAPSGTHTVTATLKVASLPSPIAISSSFRCVAL